MGEQQVENEIIHGVDEIEGIVKSIPGPTVSKPVFENLMRIVDNIVREKSRASALRLPAQPVCPEIA